MSEDVKNYLGQVVRTFEIRNRWRGALATVNGGRPMNRLKKWERELYYEAKRLLKEEQTDLDLDRKLEAVDNP
jgi:hypothetical protein